MRRFRFHRLFFVAPLVAIVSVVLATGQASAQDAEQHAAIADQQTDAARTIDQLLTSLKRERNPEAANRISAEIMGTWNDSGSPTVNLLMQWANTAISEKRNPAALDFIDQAIVLKPDFVGAWNLRATLNYTMGNYRKSVSDINHVLSLEPRHFGALAGLAAILSERGSEEMALKAWERYLDIYPADRDAQNLVNKLEEKLAGSRT
ncbi:hypothetical protein NBH20_06765 [Rhizobium sp. S153]|uniref:Tetratricopeptide repeat protein n=1 Tax=Ciceribacter sichuanensis TaxID=2949647 RepID=A0ABT0V4M3_9HYPH|nr:hypothetical protein [Ciceribacter sp. S153]MCM2400851.1 hypothetical protein [Ciceribacter sp. S153]